MFHQWRKRALQHFFYILSIFVLSKVKIFADCHPPPRNFIITRCTFHASLVLSPHSPVTYKSWRRCSGDARHSRPTSLDHTLFECDTWREQIYAPLTRNRSAPLSISRLYLLPLMDFQWDWLKPVKIFFSFFRRGDLTGADRLSTPESLPDIFLFLDPSSHGIFLQRTRTTL